MPGKLIVVSGPSGSGKTTVLARLLANPPVPLRMSVSATTRPPRAGERDGVNYHFLSQAEFDRRRQAGEFLECFEVFGRGHWYGTLREEVAHVLQGVVGRKVGAGEEPRAVDAIAQDGRRRECLGGRGDGRRA